MAVRRYLPMESRPYRFNNHFKLLLSGDDFLTSVLAGIESARHRILFEMYLVEPGHSFELLWQKFCEAANRGVSVFILLDDFGSRLVLPRCIQLSQAHPTMYLSVYNPVSWCLMSANFNRDHRKLIVIDDSTAWLGGFGICDNFYDKVIARTDYREPVWMDVGVRVRGLVVRDWVRLFFGTWHSVRSKLVDSLITVQTARSEERTISSFSLLGDDSFVRNTQPSGQHTDYSCIGRMAYGAQRHRQDIVREFIKRIRTARQRVWLTSPYFVTTRQIRRALRRASQRGVDVKVIVPGPYMDHPSIRYAGRRHYGELIAAGVKIFEYQRSFLHAKCYLCDEWISMGSFNLDHWTYRWNLEANQEIVCDTILRKMLVVYAQLIAASEQVTPGQMKRVSLKVRILVFILGKIEELVLRFVR